MDYLKRATIVNDVSAGCTQYSGLEPAGQEKSL